MHVEIYASDIHTICLIITEQSTIYNRLLDPTIYTKTPLVVFQAFEQQWNETK